MNKFANFCKGIMFLTISLTLLVSIFIAIEPYL